MQYSFTQFITDALMPYKQTRLLEYAVGAVPFNRDEACTLLKDLFNCYQKPGFLPLVDDAYVERLEFYVDRYFSESGATNALSVEVCRAIATMHIPGVVQLSANTIKRAFENYG